MIYSGGGNRLSSSINGFTLAEVLITLGVIGVVAALTIPTLIANHRKQEYTARLKKGYTVINSGFQQLILNNGCEGNFDALRCTGLFGDDDSYKAENPQWVENIDREIRKVFNVTKTCKVNDTSCAIQYRYLSGGLTSKLWFNDGYTFITSDGYMIYLSYGKCTDYPNSISPKLKSICGWISFDVNGFKKPNQYGRDFFEFVISQSGYLYPAVSVDYAQAVAGEGWETSTSYWRNSPGQCGKPGEKPPSNAGGSNCAARIMENGWKMDY